MDIHELLEAALARGREVGAGDGATALGAGGLGLYLASGADRPDHVVYEPVFCLVLQGAKAIRSGERTVAFGAGQSLVIGVELAVATRVVAASPAAPYVSLSVRPDMALLRELAGDLPPPPQAPDAAPGSAGFGASEADAMALAAMGRLLGLAGQPRAERALAPLALREVHFWMLEGPHGPMLRRLVRADGPAARIARAVAAIRADPARPLRVADLAREAAMSVSAFHARFREVTATTPLQFQKRLRLIEARRLLRAGGAAVGAAAFRVGYESPTQFSRDYRRAFGLAPREERGADGGADRGAGPALAAE